MKIKKLFLLRHASFDNTNDADPPLSDGGEWQAGNLAESIEENLNGDISDITIWTSSAKRAKETALIILRKFPSATFVEYQKLWCDRDHKHDFNWFSNELDNFDGKILIVISHLEYVCDFPKEKLGFDKIRASCAMGILVENGQQSHFE